MKEMARQVLMVWKQKEGNEAFKQDVIDALHKVGRKDIVDKVFKVSETSTKVPKQYLFPNFWQILKTYAPMMDVPQSIQQKQREFYQRLTVPSVSWLNRTLHLGQIYIEQDLYVIERRQQKPEKFPSLSSIFENCPRSILITGPSKSGKTTLLAKLLYDWSMYESYISSLFDFVFVIPLRNFQKDLTKAIFRQCDVQADDIQKRKAVFANEEKVLLVLDGVDEMSSKVRKDLEKFLEDPKFSAMTIIVTCREVKQSYVKNRISSLINGKQHLTLIGWKKPTCPRKIVLGEVPKNQLPIKYLNTSEHEQESSQAQQGSSAEDTDTEDTEDNSTKGLRSIQCPEDITQAPLMYVFFTLFAKSINMQHNKPNKAELYKMMCAFLVKSMLENQPNSCNALDIFDSKNKIYSSFIQLGKTSYQKLKQRTLIYEEEEITRDFSKRHHKIALGFFTQPVTFFQQSNNVYEPLYEGFMELFAANYLSTLEMKDMCSEVRTLLESDIPWNQTGFLLTFLASFLGDKAYHLLELVRPFHGFTIDSDAQFDDILSGVSNLSDKNLSAIATYMHPVWDDDKLDVYPRSQCLHYGIRYGVVLKVKLNSGIFWKYFSVFPEDVEVPELMIYSSGAKPPLTTFSRKVPCKTLFVKMDIYNSQETWDNFAMLVDNIRYKHLVLLLAHYDTNREQVFSRSLVTKYLDNFNLLLQWLPKFKFYRLLLLQLSKADFFDLIPVLEHMLDNGNIVNGLRFDIGGMPSINETSRNNRSQLKSFLEKVAASSIRTFFFDDNGSYSLPFNLVNSEDKQWEYIYFTESIETLASQTQPDSIQVDHLDCQGFKESTTKEKLANLRNLQTLTCFDGMLQAVQDLPESWEGFRTVKEVHILRFKDNLSLQKFPNINKLSIEFSWIFDHKNEDSVATRLHGVIISLPLKMITFKRTNSSDHVKFIRKFLLRLAKDPGSIQLEEFVIEFNGVVDLEAHSFSLLHKIQECFTKRVMLKCSFLFYNVSPVENIQSIWKFNKTLQRPFNVHYEPYLSDPFQWQDVHQIVFQPKRYYVCLTLL